MPVYEYKCRKCGNEFETEQRITEDPLTKCPDENCGGEVFRKISKNVGLLFKGSGFYLTDYGKKNGSSAPANGNGHAKNGEQTSSSTSSDVPKAETKPETKSESAPAKKETVTVA